MRRRADNAIYKAAGNRCFVNVVPTFKRNDKIEVAKRDMEVTDVEKKVTMDVSSWRTKM